MSRNRDTFNEINITPLTDIFLVLLIIMMVIAPMLDQQGLNLTVPENVAQEQVQNKETKIMTIMISADDKFYLDGNEIQSNDLESAIASESKNYPDGLLIKTDADSSHGAMVRVMDSARNSGVTSISVDQISHQTFQSGFPSATSKNFFILSETSSLFCGNILLGFVISTFASESNLLIFSLIKSKLIIFTMSPSLYK